MASITHSIVQITDAMVELFKDEQEELGLKDIWYGDEEHIPRTPALSVLPNYKERELGETGPTTLNQFRMQLTVFHSRLADPGVTRRECDLYAESIEAFLHEPTNRKLDGLVVFGYVTRVEPGLVTRERVIMRATRLIWEGLSKTKL